MKAAIFNKKEGKWVQEYIKKDYYSVQETAQLLGTGGPSVYAAVNRGTIPAFSVGGVVKVKHEDLMAYIATRTSAGTISSDDIVPYVPQRKARRQYKERQEPGDFLSE